MKIYFFEIRLGEEDYLRKNLPGHELRFFKDSLTLSNLDSILNADIVSTHTDSKIDAQVIEKLSNLKLIATRTTGFDHIDLDAASKNDILVCNVPAYGDVTVAEFTFALILSISRKIPECINAVKNNFQFNTGNLQGFDLRGKTLGVLGTGKIGQNVIRIANGFGMKVLAFDVYQNLKLKETLNFEYVSLEEVLKASEIITVHVPYMSSTHHLINKGTLQNLKKGVVIINTSRGAVIETAALVEGLKKGIVKSVGLDVLEGETFLKHSEPNMSSEDQAVLDDDKYLINNPAYIITPHNAFNTIEAEQKILQTTIENIESFTNGNPANVVK